MLMSIGLPYDSDGGRDYAAAITAVMCGQSYLTSARIAEATGPCPGYAINEESFLEVVRMHRDSVTRIDSRRVPPAMFKAAKQAVAWRSRQGERSRIPQCADHSDPPTGTIGFMMDCDTTGIEPDLALVKYKKLVGGGVIKIVNHTVPQALIRLGYTADQVERL